MSGTVEPPRAHWHFIGIGGVGMSGCAALAHERGYRITGSDVEVSALTLDLERRGVVIHSNNDPRNLDDQVQAVVISTVIPDDNPELIEARRRGIQVLHRSEALEHLVRDRFYVGVIGSAGKGTTAGAITAALDLDGRSPGFYMGWKLRDFDLSVRDGAEYMVLEIDESDGSMRNFSPDMVVITNLYREHLDYYGDHATMLRDFRRWIEGNRCLRTLVLNADDPGCRELGATLHLADAVVVWYGFETGGDRTLTARGAEVRVTGEELRFEMRLTSGTRQIISPLAVRFNGSNLLAAAAAAASLGVAPEVVQAAFSGYRGVANRLTDVELGGVTFVGAYVAVPESVDMVVDHLCDAFDPDDMLVVFQPNRTWRLEAFLNPYAESLRKAGNVIVTDLAQTWEGRTERHDQVREQWERGGNAVLQTPQGLVDRIGSTARYIPNDRLDSVLARSATEFKVVAVLAGGESYISAKQHVVRRSSELRDCGVSS